MWCDNIDGSAVLGITTGRCVHRDMIREGKGKGGGDMKVKREEVWKKKILSKREVDGIVGSWGRGTY